MVVVVIAIRAAEEVTVIQTAEEVTLTPIAVEVIPTPIAEDINTHHHQVTQEVTLILILVQAYLARITMDTITEEARAVALQTSITTTTTILLSKYTMLRLMAVQR